MRSIRRLLSPLLLLGLLAGCGLLNEGDDTDENGDTSPTIQAPQVISFDIDEVVANSAGESFVTLTWQVSGTDPEISISPAPGTVTGTRVTLLLGATTYTLTATNSAGKSSKSVTVNEDGQPVPPEEDPEPPSVPPEEAPLNLTGTWRLTAPKTIYNDCPLDWLFELSQVDSSSGTVLTGSYGYGRDDPNASDPLLTCSGTYEGTFNPALEGSVGDDGTITLTGDYIYGADYTGAPPEEEDHIILEATATDADTLAVELEAVSTGGGGAPFSATATMERVYDEPGMPAD